jgi:hypothetical protein
MANVEVKLDDEGMKVLLTKAILDSISEEKRDELIKSSIRGMFEPVVTRRPGSFGTDTSPSWIETQLQYAAQAVARQILDSEMSKPENQERIRAVVVEAFDRLFSAPGAERRKALVEKLSESISRTLVGNNY